MTDSDKERKDLSDRIGILEHLLLGSKHYKGWLARMDDEIEAVREKMKEQSAVVAKMHSQNEKRLRRIQNIGWVLMGIFIAFGIFSGLKLSAMEDMLKIVSAVIK